MITFTKVESPVRRQTAPARLIIIRGASSNTNPLDVIIAPIEDSLIIHPLLRWSGQECCMLSHWINSVLVAAVRLFIHAEFIERLGPLPVPGSLSLSENWNLLVRYNVVESTVPLGHWTGKLEVTAATVVPNVSEAATRFEVLETSYKRFFLRSSRNLTKTTGSKPFLEDIPRNTKKISSRTISKYFYKICMVPSCIFKERIGFHEISPRNFTKYNPLIPNFLFSI